MALYNAETYLRQAVNSVLAQTYTDFELIMVDDGSTDRSGQIADDYATTDHRITVIHQANSGQATARNNALKVARGELITFVDSDDWIEPQMYERMIQALDETSADVALCSFAYEFIDRSRQKSHFPQAVTLNHDDTMRELFLDHGVESFLWDKIFRREIISAPFPVGMKYEDTAVMHLWLNNIGRMTLVNEPLYHYRMRCGSTVYQSSVKTRIDKLKADIARAEFYRTLNLTDITHERINIFVAESAVNCAKYIARYPIAASEADTSIQTIITLASPFFKAVEEVKALPEKSRKRIHRLLRHPRLFRISMRLSRMLQISKLHKEHNLYP